MFIPRTLARWREPTPDLRASAGCVRSSLRWRLYTVTECVQSAAFRHVRLNRRTRAEPFDFSDWLTSAVLYPGKRIQEDVVSKSSIAAPQAILERSWGVSVVQKHSVVLGTPILLFAPRKIVIQVRLSRRVTSMRAKHHSFVTKSSTNYLGTSVNYA